MPDFEKRRDKLRRKLKQEGVDALLVTNFVNVTYLTGFTGDDSYLLLRKDGQSILSDPRYSEQLEEECPGVDLEIRFPPKKMPDLVEKVVKASKTTRVAIEADSMTVGTKETFEGRLKDVAFVSTRGWVEELRRIKDRDEINEIRESVHLAEEAFKQVRSRIRPELTEKQVADDLDRTIRDLGGEKMSFTPIVAVGRRAALPHARATKGMKIEDAGFVLIDWGAQARLYKSDLTRVLATAKISPKLERIYGVVLKAQKAAIDAVRPGVLMKDIDHAARSVIEDAGFGKQFTHSLGHGIGLDIHEAPRLASDEKKPLEAGMVITIEPGIYVTNWGGVRLEDDVLVKRNGAEVLSSLPKELEECVVAK